MNTLPGDIRLDPADFARTGRQPLGSEDAELLHRAYELFELFREELAPQHEAMREARRMRQLKNAERSETSPMSMALNSCVDNAIADQIDNMPEAIMVPETLETSNTADEMTDVVSFVLYKANFAGKYFTLMEDAAVTGTGVAQMIWDADAMNGKGLANVLAWHPEDFYPDPMYEDIQDGRGCFKATTTTIAWVAEHYPHAAEYVQPDEIRPEDEHTSLLEVPSGDSKVTVLEFWYRRYDAKKRRYRIHMAQMAGGALLVSTETGFGLDTDAYSEGVYAHGKYPFHMFRYRTVFRNPFGTGLMADYESTQNAINRYSKYIDDNARESSLTRHFIRRGSGVNPEEVADLTRTVIEWDGSDIREVIQSVQTQPLNSQVFQMLGYLVDSMKQDSGQNQFNRGETGGGITAATAIRDLITQGGKITRWHAEQFRCVFREMIEQMLWIISEYMDSGRTFRIVGGWDSGRGLDDKIIELRVPDSQGDAMPPPEYSVRVQVQKHSPAWTEKFNETLMRMAEIAAQAGVMIPADVLLESMQGYPDKARIVRMLREEAEKHDKMAQMQAQIDELTRMLEDRDKLVAGWESAMSEQGGGAVAVNAPPAAALSDSLPGAEAM